MRVPWLFTSVLVVATAAGGCAWSVGSSEGAEGHSGSAASPAALPPSTEAEVAELPTAAVAAPRQEAESRFSVQVSSIQNERAARDAAQGLADRGFPSFVLTHPEGGATYYQVRVGPFGDRDSAEAIAATLKSLGYSTWILTE